MNKGRITASDIARIGIMSAALTAGKTALAFLPNIEVVSLLIILYSIYFGKKVIFAVLVFIALECMIWGVNLWTLMYIYIWPLLAAAAWVFRKKDDIIFWSVFSAVFGLMFGGLCSLVYVFAGGFKTAFYWWIAGIPMDVVHCIGNFFIMLFLYKPLRMVLDRAAGTAEKNNHV